jgi:hypothetical protein
MEEANVDMRRKYIHVAKGCILDASRRMAVVQQFGNILAAIAHLRKPVPRNDREFLAL